MSFQFSVDVDQYFASFVKSTSMKVTRAIRATITKYQKK